MQSIDFCYLTAFISIVYLINLLCKKAYRLILPSVIHTTSWLLVSCLLICELKGVVVSSRIPNDRIDLSSEYILYLVIASIIGFFIAHIIGDIRKARKKVIIIEGNRINTILNRFRWIPYISFLIGLIIFVYLFSTIGILNAFSEFREYAVTMRWSGPMAYVQQISGHVNIWGTFYLMLLGYKHGKEGLNKKEFFKFLLLCSTINLAIGGRLWIVTSTLPYFTAYTFARTFSERNKKSRDKDTKSLIAISLTLACIFSTMGLLRDSEGSEKKFMDKFLYFTDGTKMTNMVLRQYPPGTYELEYGSCEFLSQFKQSPMNKRFVNYISDDAGLSVTVRSAMPPLYYDFGYVGGIIMWGVFCFIIEFSTIKLLSTKKIVGILLFAQLSQMLFLAPIFEIFSVYMPFFEWLLIISLFSKYIFDKRQTI